MKLLACALMACAGLTAQPNVAHARFETRAFSGDLAAQIRGAGPAWFGYAVRTDSSDRQSCCWENSRQCGCSLESGRGDVTIGSHSGPVQLEGSAEMAVLFRVVNDGVQKVQAYTLSCPLDAGGLPFVWITGVPAGASLSWLEHLAATDTADRVADGAVMAIAQHDDPHADDVLERFTQSSQPMRLREKAVFWLGAARGARGVAILKNLLEHDASSEIRDKAIFALSISKQPEALEWMIQAARNDPSSHVRGQAIFWLAQKAGKRAVSTITDAIANDPDTEVKKRAVFALSQLPKDEGVPKLIDVARNQKNPEVRKQAFFWLGQSGDPRALAFIEQVLTR
ncbi:MAG TPA: HEAT repeat domain-containing protein [Bryobacteraceae bacterium]|nr:HEAT repeat domain-containing protein [Bryobacteraceae bacterium]